jgi:hypothetical protein
MLDRSQRLEVPQVCVAVDLRGIKVDRKLIFPVLLLLCNLGSACVYLAAGDWKRAAYWGASAVCIAVVTF